MIADILKELRQQNHMTQAELASQLGITRAGVNAWEMGISVPSTQSIIQLASIFNISTDYLLGMESTSTVNVSGLSPEDVEAVCFIIEHLRKKNKSAD